MTTMTIPGTRDDCLRCDSDELCHEAQAAIHAVVAAQMEPGITTTILRFLGLCDAAIATMLEPPAQAEPEWTIRVCQLVEHQGSFKVRAADLGAARVAAREVDVGTGFWEACDDWRSVDSVGDCEVYEILDADGTIVWHDYHAKAG